MANMSYCRFENTAGHVHDCSDAINEAQEENITSAEFIKKLSSDHERRAFALMYEECRQFIELYEAFAGGES